MEFRVRLEAIEGYAINAGSTRLGLDALDQARAVSASNVSNLDATCVDAFVRSLARNLFIVVSEALARASGRFADDCVCVVNCPDGWANRFIGIVSRAKRDDVTGEVVHVGWKYHFLTDAFLKLWMRKEFPLVIGAET